MSISIGGQVLKLKRVVALAAVAGFAILAAGCGSSGSSSSSGDSGCGTVSIGMLAPITGPAGSIGSDQLHWAQYYVTQWNADSANDVKLKLVQGDTQLDPAKAST